MTPVVLAVAEELDVFGVRRAAREAARAAGLGRESAEELVIAASELAWNLIRHAGSGRIEISTVNDPARGVGIRLEAQDRGPPFVDFATALKDRSDDRGSIDPMHFSRRRGIASGLGAVARFTDRVWCEQRADGKSVIAIRWASRRARTQS